VTLKKVIWILAASFLLFAITSTASAQQFDIAFGYGTLGGNAAGDATVTQILNGSHQAQTISGGGYPSFSGDFLFIKKYLGVGGEVTWRAHQNVDIFGEPYRPILYDFNGVFAPPIGKKAQAEFQAGIGAESLRFYQQFFNCNFFGCTNYSSSNHFLGHFGGGLRLYVWHSVFIRPEAHLYVVHNNFEFSGPRVMRYAISIGYSLRNTM
jgi:hypothetical protein